MATLTQLYTRIILDLNRDDMGASGELEQAKIDAVAAAIDNHADELFWFNRASGTKATVASTATIALPTGMRIAKQISYQQTPLTKVKPEDIQYLTTTGLPTRWAESDGAIQLYPIPNAIYTLSLYGVADLGVPATTNEWSTEAYELIAAEAKMILCRGPLRDPEGLGLARDGRDEALAKLRRESRTRGMTGLVADLPPEVGTYNINAG
jgi:hypothetical protein